MTKYVVATTLIVGLAAQQSADAEGDASPASMYVTMVSHFDRPWVMTHEDLEAFERLTKNHPRMRWTHLYNPAAYTQPTPLRREMEEFVIRSRDRHGAEIGLHLHMYEGLLKAAGVTFRAHPSVNAKVVAGSSDSTGYSVPMNHYTPEEIGKLLEFTLETFRDRGLGQPATFCAGYYTTSLDLQKEVTAKGFTTSAAAFPPGTEIGRAYPPAWHELSGWDETVRFDTLPYRVSRRSILPDGGPPYIEAVDGRPLVELPQTCKIDWMVSSDDMKVIIAKHLSIAEKGRPTAVCLAMHEMDARENFAKYDEVLAYVDALVADSDRRPPVRYATASKVRAGFLEHWAQ